MEAFILLLLIRELHRHKWESVKTLNYFNVTLYSFLKPTSTEQGGKQF